MPGISWLEHASTVSASALSIEAAPHPFASAIIEPDLLNPQKCAKDGIFRPTFEEKQRFLICKCGNFEATAGDRPCVTPRGTRAGSGNRAEI
jgi:hypothetical protein